MDTEELKEELLGLYHYFSVFLTNESLDKLNRIVELEKELNK